MLNHIRTVLIHNSHPGNIGAVARALKNMGLSQLYLVAPKRFPAEEATARAKDAIDILENAVVVQELSQALEGCQWVLGSSGRLRTLPWPVWNAREAAQKVISNLSNHLSSEMSAQTDAEPTPNVAILYGCEQHGLSNEELHHCHGQIIIPANSDYASLNLAQAVQIISYELRIAYQDFLEHQQANRENSDFDNSDRSNPADFEAMEGFYQHLEQTFLATGFLEKERPGLLMPRLRRFFNRAQPDMIEMNILRGFLKSIPITHNKIADDKKNQTPAIYLDYAATTPVDPRVASKMAEYLTMEGIFGNPASSHDFGQQAKNAVAFARQQVADLINANPESIIWTSGATEANNLAIKGAALFYQRQGKHIITSQSEHRAVLDSCQALARLGFEFTYLKPNPQGLIDIDAIRSAIRDDTVLVSIMHVNNETGVIQDIAAIGEMLKTIRSNPLQEILFHVDAAQSVGKLSIELAHLPVDLMSFSAHKLYGPKGIGALYVRHYPKVRLTPLLDGGGQERGYRSGTLATHQCVGMGEAFQIAKEEMATDSARIIELRNEFWNELKDLPQVFHNGDPMHCIPQIINLRFEGLDKETLMADIPDIAISSGAACAGANLEASHVLSSMGLRNELAHRSVRISFGKFTTKEEVQVAAKKLRQSYLKHISKSIGVVV